MGAYADTGTPHYLAYLCKPPIFTQRDMLYFRTQDLEVPRRLDMSWTRPACLATSGHGSRRFPIALTTFWIADVGQSCSYWHRLNIHLKRVISRSRRTYNSADLKSSFRNWWCSDYLVKKKVFLLWYLLAFCVENRIPAKVGLVFVSPPDFKVIVWSV